MELLKTNHNIFENIFDLFQNIFDLFFTRSYFFFRGLIL
jgi:hypothetical protein